MVDVQIALAAAESLDCKTHQVPKVSLKQPLRITSIQEMAIRCDSPMSCFAWFEVNMLDCRLEQRPRPSPLLSASFP